MSNALFEGEALARLRLAAEEIAFLTGRGYPAREVSTIVAAHRGLLPLQLAVLARAVCSEPQYRGRASREMLPEDIAKRPLVVDAHDVLDTITTALAGGMLLEGLDQTMQPLTPVTPDTPSATPEHVDAALERIGPILREMRPSKSKWLLDAARTDAPALAEKLVRASKKWKVPVEAIVVDAPKTALRTSANVVTNDPAIIDACKSWCNLSGPVVAAIEGARRLKLQ